MMTERPLGIGYVHRNRNERFENVRYYGYSIESGITFTKNIPYYRMVIRLAENYSSVLFDKRELFDRLKLIKSNLLNRKRE